MSSDQNNSLLRQKLLLELNEKILKQKKDLDDQLEDLTLEKEHLESEKKKIEEKNALLWEQSAAIHKEKERIEKIKIAIEHRHKEMLDSVNYAKRIQQAILPEKSKIQDAFPQSFVLFKPKDIVSGDFYWFDETEAKYFIAAADCTGHGVPGALMSMLGADTLNNALIQTTDVSGILSYLNKGIKKVLKQSANEESTRDGMDIALCSYSKDLSILEYAAANRALWIIRNGKDEIDEIKATKKAIGGLTEDEQEFIKHTFAMQKGDLIYMTSDGFADQFGSNDKKLMTKKFKELIVSIKSKSMTDQMEFLDEFITKWKGDMEQTDDILVIGIRI